LEQVSLNARRLTEHMESKRKLQERFRELTRQTIELRKKYGIVKRKLERRNSLITVYEKFGKKGKPVTKKNMESGMKKVKELIKKKEGYKEDMTLLANRCVGKTMFLLEDEKVGLRLDTFFGGEFQERYYVILSYDAGKSKMFVYRHTVPFFIPLKKIEEQYLNTNLRQFVDVLHNHLMAFVNRRGYIENLHKNVIEGLIVGQSNLSYDYLNIKYKMSDDLGFERILDVNLDYGDSDKSLPTGVEVNLIKQNTNTIERKEKFEPFFKENEIIDALRLCYPTRFDNSQ